MMNSEDDLPETERRLFALMIQNKISWDDIRDEKDYRLHKVESDDRILTIAKKSPETGKIEPEDVEWLIAYLKKHTIDLLIVDPFAETHDANENDNNDIKEIARLYRTVSVNSDYYLMTNH